MDIKKTYNYKWNQADRPYKFLKTYLCGPNKYHIDPVIISESVSSGYIYSSYFDIKINYIVDNHVSSRKHKASKSFFSKLNEIAK